MTLGVRAACFDAEGRIFLVRHTYLPGWYLPGGGVERGALSKEQVAQTLQEGLDELRLLMDSSDLGRSLHDALAAWRNRWDARLQALGMQLRWSVDDELESLELGSDATLQVMRVLQEAVANAVKHSGAQHVTVLAWREAGADQHERRVGEGLRDLAHQALFELERGVGGGFLGSLRRGGVGQGGDNGHGKQTGAGRGCGKGFNGKAQGCRSFRQPAMRYRRAVAHKLLHI